MPVKALPDDVSAYKPPVAASPPRRGRRWVAWAAAGVLLLHATLAWVLRIPAVTTGNDDAVYLLLAKSVRHLGYNEIFYVGSPPHAQYPPLYPSLLALTGALTGDHLDAHLALGVLCSVAALALLFDVVRRRWSPPFALLALTTAALNPALLIDSGRVMSEAPFMALTMLALWAAARTPQTPRSLALAGGAALAAALTRSAGVPIVAALVLLWLLERRFRAAGALLAAAAGTIGVWLAWTALAPRRVAGRSYVADAIAPTVVTGDAHSSPAGFVGLLARRVAHNIPEYLARGVPWELSVPTVQGTAIDNVTWLLVIAVTVGVGLWILWKRWRAAALALVCYLGLLLIWPWTHGRFLHPVLPVLAVASLAGARALGSRWHPRAASALPLALGVAVSAGALSNDVAALREMSRCDRSAPLRSAGCFNADQRSFFAAAAFAAERTPESAVFASAKEGTLAYYSGRRLVPLDPLMQSSPERFLDYLAERGVSYVLLGHLSPADYWLGRRLADLCDRLELVAEFPPRTFLLRLTPAGQRDARRTGCAATAAHTARTGPFLPVSR